MRLALPKRAAPFLGLGLFLLAAWALSHQLHHFQPGDIVRQIRKIPPLQIWSAVVLTIISYLLMSGYDFLALRYIRHPLGFAKSALASFLGYAFSNNIGFSMIAGASVRYRLYSAWGFSALEITQVVLFCSVSLWLGFFLLSGVVFVVEPLALPGSLHLPFTSTRPLGMLLSSLATGYFLTALFRKKALTVREWRWEMPSWRLAVGQMIIAGMDWLFAGTVLFVLLPKELTIGFGHFLEIFLLAQFVGLVSQVPGGLGIFESIILLLLPDHTGISQVVGSMVVYRGIYYLAPLLAATITLGTETLMRHRHSLRRLQNLTAGALETVFVPLLSLAVFTAGAILLFSGSLPAIPHRLLFLTRYLPMQFVEVSHFLGSVTGMGLLLLARGIQQRLDAAYLLTMGLLVLGILASLLKGFDYEEALILLLLVIVLLPGRHLFFRRASLFSANITAGWLAAITVVIFSSIWLGWFSFKHVEYSHELWWHFSARSEAPRFLRATVGALALMLVFSLTRLLRPVPYRPKKGIGPIPEEVIQIVAQSSETEANLALLGDKHFMFDPQHQAFIMYGVSGETWVAMGDPVGPQACWLELLWQFRQSAFHHADRAVFYEVNHETLHFYLDMGLTLLKLGEEGRVPLNEFSLEGHGRRELRYTHRKMTRAGCSFEMIPRESVPELIEILQEISDAWLQEKNTREKGFSLGFFDKSYIRHFPLGIVRHGDRIVAFTNIWTAADHNELSIDLMRHLPDAPNGVMDFMFTELMLWGGSQGYRWFNLGMAPFSGMQTHEPVPLWYRLSDLVVRFGDHFYNFKGLRAYKEKFDPVWRPKYLATPGGLALPRVLTDISVLVSGGLKGVVGK